MRAALILAAEAAGLVLFLAGACSAVLLLRVIL